MRRACVGAVLAAVLVVAVGCATMPMGAVNAPIQDLKSPVAVGTGQVGGPNVKVGEATAQGFLIVGWGDASIQTAARNGGITQIHYVDSQQLNILGIYSRNTIRVYGQ